MGLGNVVFGGTNIRYGPVTDKPANCSPGDMYIATDTDVMYVCYTEDIWDDPVGRDETNGVAGLDGNGDILGKGDSLYLTRDGSNIIRIRERTSGDTIFYITRNDSQDFIGKIQVNGTLKEFLTTRNMITGSYVGNDSAGSRNIAHGLGQTPAYIQVYGQIEGAYSSFGFYNGATGDMMSFSPESGTLSTLEAYTIDSTNFQVGANVVAGQDHRYLNRDGVTYYYMVVA